MKAYLLGSALALVLATVVAAIGLSSVPSHSDMAAAAVAGFFETILVALLLQGSIGSLLVWLVGKNRWGRGFFVAYALVAVAGVALAFLPRYFKGFDESPRSNWRFVVTRDLAGLLRRRHWPKDPGWDHKFRKAIDLGAKVDYFALIELGDEHLDVLRLALDRGALKANDVLRANCNGMACATTPLAHMSEALQIESAKLLLSRGADPKLRFNDLGVWDPLRGAVSNHDPAYEKRAEDMIDLLMVAGGDPSLARTWIEGLLAGDAYKSYGTDSQTPAIHRRYLEHLKPR